MELRTLLLCLFLSPGCHQLTLQPAYTAQYPIASSIETATHRIQARLQQLGWRIFTRQTRSGHIVAANNEVYGSRDVVLIDIGDDGYISLWIRTDIKADGEWVKPCQVCANYSWVREQTLLTQLLERQTTNE